MATSLRHLSLKCHKALEHHDKHFNRIETFSLLGENKMGYGSAGTPPWVDEEKIDEEKKRVKTAEILEENKALKQENNKLKKQIQLLEDEIKRLKK